MKKTIFVVDDSVTNLKFAELALEKDYNILTMLSAIRMFALLRRKQPDLILLDVEMPEMTGTEAVSILKKNPYWKNIPVILYTSLNDAKLLYHAMSTGAIDVILKPATMENLLSCVRKYI